jgi:hypothetical protein
MKGLYTSLVQPAQQIPSAGAISQTKPIIDMTLLNMKIKPSKVTFSFHLFFCTGGEGGAIHRDVQDHNVSTTVS